MVYKCNNWQHVSCWLVSCADCPGISETCCTQQGTYMYSLTTLDSEVIGGEMLKVHATRTIMQT